MTVPELPEAHAIVAASLAEDLGVPASVFAPGAPPDPGLLGRDATGSSVVGPDAVFAGRVVAREDAVVCGLPLLDQVYATLSAAAAVEPPVEVFPLVAEGSRVRAGTAVAEVEGHARAVLAGERTALNLLMTLSGIATAADLWQAAAAPLAVTDTRKTLPGLRALSKYASRVGGIENHRSGLWDMVLVKDNHIRHAGGIEAAVHAVRHAVPDLVVQVEADTAAQAVEAVASGADMVLLDNMDDGLLADAVALARAEAERRGRAVVLEASGGIGLERLAGLKETGVDRVSTSAVTLARPRDFALDEA